MTRRGITGLLNDIYATVRKLAKSSKYQTFYSHSREGNLTLFKNVSDYTNIQLLFMQYLSFYANLNMDVYMDEVDAIVLDNEIYEDAYQHYKNKEKKNKRQPDTKNKRKNKNDKNGSVSNTHILFTTPK